MALKEFWDNHVRKITFPHVTHTFPALALTDISLKSPELSVDVFLQNMKGEVGGKVRHLRRFLFFFFPERLSPMQEPFSLIRFAFLFV